MSPRKTTAGAPGKAEQILRPGDLIELFMPGGGYGPPADRIEGYTTS